VNPVSGGTSARGGLDIGLGAVAAGTGVAAAGAGTGAVTAGAGFAGRVRALRGAVDAGFSAVCAAVLLLLFTTAVALATFPFAVAGFAGVLGSILVVAFTDAFALVDGRAAFTALRAGALVLAFFITSLRLTQFSGKGNPPVGASRVRRRILVDNFKRPTGP
jgi:hypothetical protein